MPIRKFKTPLKKVRKWIEDDSLDIWCEDEVHFQQYGSRCRMWVPPEVKEPVLMHNPTRESIGYFGAVRLRDGKFVYQREDEVFNKETFWSFLKTLRKKNCHSKKRVIVILDNAKYHHANLHKEWRNDCEDQFHCEFLPPYSPELNPAERIWKLTRRLCIHNRYFPKLLDVVGLVEPQFDMWSRGNDELRKLCKI